MMRFYWLEPGVLAGCSLPGGESGRWPAAGGSNLARDLDELRRQGVGAILTLTEEALDTQVVTAHGLTSLHLPVPDMTPPLPAQLQQALEFIDRQQLESRPVAVHCLMGQGRTGTVLAAYLIRSGIPAEDAIAHLRKICPGAIESPSQRHALGLYAQRRDWVL